MSVLVSDILLSSLLIWNDVLEDGKMAMARAAATQAVWIEGLRRGGYSTCSTRLPAVNSSEDDNGRSTTSERQPQDLRPLSADDIASGKRALWQRRDWFMVKAQVPIVPRATVEDSRRRILQDEIEICFRVVLHRSSDVF